MKRCLLISLVAIAALAPAAALARRQPTTSERAAIARHLGVPARCAVIWISSVDKLWASFTSSHKQSCLAHASDGIVVLHRRHGKWRQSFAGSDIPCPVPHVPPRIVTDLRIRCNTRAS